MLFRRERRGLLRERDMLVVKAMTVALFAVPLGRPPCNFAAPMRLSGDNAGCGASRGIMLAAVHLQGSAAVRPKAATRRGYQRSGVLVAMCSPPEQANSAPSRIGSISQLNFVSDKGKTTPDVPRSDVGLDGGDVWSGLRLNSEELTETVDEALSFTPSAPIIAQYYPGRRWLLAQWTGTIVKITLPREVLRSVIYATVLCVLYRVPPFAGGMIDSAVLGTCQGHSTKRTHSNKRTNSSKRTHSSKSTYASRRYLPEGINCFSY